jgi:hypothetical protein
MGRHMCLWLRRMSNCGVAVLLLSLLASTAAVFAQGPIPEESSFGPPPTVPDPQAGGPTPQDLDPPESCGVPQRGPFGQDVEILLAPWNSAEIAHQATPFARWSRYDLPVCTASECGQDVFARPLSDVAAVVLDTEQIIAVWKESSYGGQLVYNRWSSRGGPAMYGGWSDVRGLNPPPHPLGLTPDGNPALLSLHARHWAVFARVGGTIKVRQWYNENLGAWEDVPGVVDAVSDPAVVSKDPYHMALFYRGTGGRIWFTDWDGIGWRQNPVPLMPYTAYLPLVARGYSRASFAIGAASRSISDAPVLSTTGSFIPFSELGVASRNANHMAVFVVDTERRLWVKEWTERNKADWSDTRWVMLRGGNVLIERPAVASRHSNHLGVAVRDIADKPWYIEWTYASGWKLPELLDIYPAGPLTLAAPSVQHMSLFYVDENIVYQKDWTGDAGWGDREAVRGWDPTASNGQRLTAVVRRTDDIMVLGRREDGQGVYYHYTSQGWSALDSQIAPAANMYGYPRGQALAWVDGKVLWATANQGTAGAWKVDAMALGEGVLQSLALPAHPWAGWENRISLAAGDLDFDGDEEAVVATLATDLSISVLDFGVSPALSITATSVVTSVPAGAVDVSAAIGDLDGDGRQDEVAVAYRVPGGPSSLAILLYEYQTNVDVLTYRGSASVVFPDPAGDETHDSEIAIGRVHGSYVGEQLLVGDGVYLTTQPERPLRLVDTYSLTVSAGWSLYRIDRLSRDLPTLGGFTPRPYQCALTTGDVDGDGLGEIVYSFGWDAFAAGYDSQGHREYYTGGWCGGGEQRSLATGDVDGDGKAEVIYTTPDPYSSPGSTGSNRIHDLLDHDGFGWVVDLPKPDGLATVLVGDLDNDSFRSDLKGCTTVLEVSVIAVVNGAPRWYADGAPVHDSAMRYAKGEGYGGGSAYGTSTSLGSSLSVGFEAEISVPIIGIKLGEVRASVTQEFMASMGQTRAREESITSEYGYENSGDLLGIVVYNGTSYRCFYYDLYTPDSPADKSTAMVCRPLAGTAFERFRSLESWHSESFKQQAGLSWVDLGHLSGTDAHTNDVTTYPRALPVDPRTLKYTWDPDNPLIVCYDSKGGTAWWSVTDMQGGSQESTRSFESNTTVSSGVTAGSVTVDSSVTLGFGWEASRSVSWEETLELGGAIDMPADLRFQYQGYELVPYIYHAKARTLAGATYPYLEVDYYVPALGACPGQPAGR